MAEKNLSCRAEEVAACCCMDVGTVIDNTDLTVEVEKFLTTVQQAEEVLQVLTQKAQKAAMSGVEIHHQIDETEDGVKLTAKFTFDCQAEAMIFQLSSR